MRNLAGAIAAIPSGRYVAAISGGVDSMVLLDLLAQSPQLEIIVAHFDHGIRADSNQDKVLVESVARQWGLVFYSGKVSLGPLASEAVARQARYGFLRSVQIRTGVQGIVTAHHQDDVIETMALQLMRGTYRSGLSPFRAKNIVRPFVDSKKSELIIYARQNNIEWREDSTNADPAYARNRLRLGPLRIVSDQSVAAREKLVDVYSIMTSHNKVIDSELDLLDGWLLGPNGINRQKFALLPHVVARDYLARYLRSYGLQFDTPYLERLVVALKVQKPHSRVSAGVDSFIEIGLKTAKLLVQ